MSDTVDLVDPDLCNACGTCVAVCPERVVELHEGRARTAAARAELCLRCGGCVCVCPTGAMAVEGMPAEDFAPLRPPELQWEHLLASLESRRSVRAFKDKPVDRETIDRVLEAAATAPMGLPPHTTEVLVIDRREEIERLVADVREAYTRLQGRMANPLVRPFIRLAVGPELFKVLQSHVLPVSRQNNTWFEEEGGDGYALLRAGAADLPRQPLEGQLRGERPHRLHLRHASGNLLSAAAYRSLAASGSSCSKR